MGYVGRTFRMLEVTTKASSSELKDDVPYPTFELSRDVSSVTEQLEL